ncbi:hypothetical protein EW146_g9626 [Bondarzewia mesenterica]|uniref:ATP-dependent DNA helicase n=1 Tax=Bondarzewia mesenterica TaxID=1095465 RepID=A0A4S4L4V7_9AGAM|nr:hypothetical protein EW146_g9626 [Bondarzewia mesenterica]
MASSAYYLGPVGILFRGRVDPAKQRTQIYDGFLAADDDTDRDIEARVHIYVPPGDANPHDGTYFVCARIGISAAETVDVDVADTDDASSGTTSSSGRVQYVELFVTDIMKLLPARVCFRGYIIASAKAERAPKDVTAERGFDVSLSQWLGSGNRDTRVPTYNTSISVAGHPFDIRDGRCLVHVCDIGLGPFVANTAQYPVPASQPSQRRYDWSRGTIDNNLDRERMLKRRRDDDEHDDDHRLSAVLPPLFFSTMPLSSSSDAARSRRHRQDTDYNTQQQLSRSARTHLGTSQTWWMRLALRPPVPPAPLTWNRRCVHCRALLLSTEPDDKCCGHGRRVLPHLPPWPSAFNSLLHRPSFTKTFIDQCRAINNFFSFAGIAVSGSFTQFSPGTAPPTVTIMGRTYHILRDGETPAHSIHWFLYDENARTVAAHNFGIHATVIQAVRDALSQCNPYVHSLQPMRSTRQRHVPWDIELREHTATSEFAAILHAANTTALAPQAIIIRSKRQSTGQILDILSHHYEPLHYILFFPHGDPGWGISRLTTAPALSQIEWYRSRLMSDDDNRFSTLGRLTCEYLVDMFSRVEEERLAYISRERLHQADVESDRPSSPSESVQNELSLPASFLGSRAWALEETANSMALGKTFGKPSFFCTMTFNPNWPEVRARLQYGQSASDIPFTIARVFKSRLDSVVHILRTRFGKKLYLIKIIEFQRRGFPHAHIVFKVSPELPFDQLDTLISAELPLDDPALREKVLRYNMHPSNHLQHIRQHTSLDDHGHVLWRRRTDADQWVVPYCPALLNFADCHFHFDIVFTSHVFMYLYKYLHKGPDQVHFNIRHTGEPINERILAYEITRKEPSVTCLPVHLPGENRPQFRRTDESETSSTSFLHRYFLRPSCLAHYRYEQFYEQFVLYPFHGEPLRDHEYLEISQDGVHRKKIAKRSRGIKVARIRTVPFNAGDVFYLRLILLHTPARSFVDARTVHTVTYTMFYDAAKALLLVHDDNEGFLALDEAVRSLRTPAQLRFLFVRIIVEGYPPLPLWNSFRDSLALDHYDRTQSTATAIDLTLRDIATLLGESGRSLHSYSLPEPCMTYSQEVQHELAFFERQLQSLRMQSEEMYASLTAEQRIFFDEILGSVENPRSGHTMFFIEGRPGRGKTYMINTLATALRSRSHIVLIVGTTALAATLYTRGRTAHHLFGIPITENNVNVKSKVSVYSQRADLIRAASLIIWDELPMANKAAWECVDNLCRSLKHSDLPFGGLPFVGLGDFRQVAPVVPNSGLTAILRASVKSSHLWTAVAVRRLTIPIRTADDPAYTELIDSIGEDTTHDKVSLATLPATTSVAECLDFLYPPHILPNASLCLNRGFLSPLNSSVDEFNSTTLSAHPGDELLYYSSDALEESDTADAPELLPDYFSQLKQAGVPDHELTLKTGSICTIARNLSVDKGLVHNARVEVVSLRHRSVDIRILGRSEIHSLPRIMFTFRPPYSSWTVNRRQFPLRVAYATTFNSCLGQTLDCIVVDVRSPVFAHGQLYTALSRVRNSNDVFTTHFRRLRRIRYQRRLRPITTIIQLPHLQSLLIRRDPLFYVLVQ